MKNYDYVAYDLLSQEQQEYFKKAVIDLHNSIESLLGNGLSASHATEALEVAYMWIGKAIRDCQLERNKK